MSTQAPEPFLDHPLIHVLAMEVGQAKTWKRARPNQAYTRPSAPDSHGDFRFLILQMTLSIDLEDHPTIAAPETEQNFEQEFSNSLGENLSVILIVHVTSWRHI